MARVRVYLITFRRPQLLPRALDSLRAQTFTDWVCDLHNDDPTDDGPGKLVAKIDDPRIRLINASHKIGVIESFNAAHEPAAEPFQSLLEDDNWWEPTFLEKMVALLDTRPELDLAWANMRYWHEQPDGTWQRDDRCVWNLTEGPPRVFNWPNLLQFDDSLYSNGAMLVRSRVAGRLVMPLEVSRDLMEQSRERMMDFPIALVPEPLANFAVTRQTMRSTNHIVWGETQTLLGAAFLAHVPMTDRARAALWARRRAARPRGTSSLINAGLVQCDWAFLRHAKAFDWLMYARGVIRRPAGAWRILRVKRRRRWDWEWLDRLIGDRTDEARARGFRVLDAESLLDKQTPGNHGLESTG